MFARALCGSASDAAMTATARTRVRPAIRVSWARSPQRVKISSQSWSPPLPQKPKAPPPPAIAPATVPPAAEGAHQLATVPAVDAGLPLAGEPLPAAEVHP